MLFFSNLKVDRKSYIGCESVRDECIWIFHAREWFNFLPIVGDWYCPSVAARPVTRAQQRCWCTAFRFDSSISSLLSDDSRFLSWFFSSLALAYARHAPPPSRLWIPNRQAFLGAPHLACAAPAPPYQYMIGNYTDGAGPPFWHPPSRCPRVSVR